MDLSSLPGLGPKRLEKLNKSGLSTIADLLYNIPRTYLDQTKVSKIAELHDGDRAVVIGIITRAGIVKGRMSRFMAVLTDGTAEISLLFFRGTRFIANRVKPGTRWLVSGTVGSYRGLQLVHPDMQPFDEGEAFNGQILPVYPISEVCREAKMEQRFFRNLYKTIFNFPGLTLPNACPRELTDYLHFAPVMDNLRTLHMPKDFDSIYKAKRELKILELLPFCLRMVKRRENQKIRGHERQIDLGNVMAAKARLPFQLTAGQDAALNTIIDGLNGKKQFHALLQGDVGCGKTVVAMLAIMAVCGAGEQCALMVPTDILARQHFKSLKPFFDAAGIRVHLLVGATPAAEKKVILGELQMGLCNVVIGTHALFSKDVFFAKLGLVIIDEQHRFGVSQREALLAKGDYPDMLVMSATPIPRSLAMTLYGDLKVISIKEKPAGRKPIKTRLVNAAKRESMKQFICKEAAGGNLCYWIASRVNADGSDNADESSARSVDDIVNEMRSFIAAFGHTDANIAKLKVAGVHGQMDDTQRDEIIKRFAAGEIQILVATTVIEVGVNVPAANLMVIDQPDRFGLAQLHQLRGRVGRGNQEAWCFLMTPEGEAAETSMERLSQFAATEDGFEIAELDLKTRGAGNLEGNEQSGAWVFRWFDWIHDQELISQTLERAEHILKDGSAFNETAKEKIQTWYNEKPSANEDGVH
ncbi:ATP-dependent DNA helicase RecG [Fibrobacter succinogenes subsp. succinogenes S85]|uniref:Probable DNA 3'-5' helicase RecG n=1 Tax=Fibrobacter succinogenes (strain ATCC 19169 / S85) TaxID=59374 RepID=C9RM88_FIBSS|nr:ATP-dependent DNA helicase RecG [Fibrobacter succinogenes]ACX74250.1 DEAD/DEAH box helicase domain protein [Fibrobacter succinogenes subsp. succinogenes S85]ADL27375.1 ATP-dependent DNA helicase RecG [Fibrobacter succinogenes subsp. succinogenes S85]